MENFHWSTAYAKIFLIALLVTALTTPVIRRLALMAGAIDHPSAVKIHKVPTPRLGGVAIYLGFLISQLLIGTLTDRQVGVIIGATLVLIVGILDDTKSVSAWIKLTVLFILTAFLAYQGVILDLTPWLPVNFFLTLFWIVGVTSAMNAMDHMDGVASGLTTIISGCYVYVAIQNGQWGWGALSVALMGSSLGFLFHNFPPAKIFMGDSGSFFIGYAMGSMGVLGTWSTNPFKSIAVPVFILGLPIFDLIYVILKRHHHRVTRSIRQIVTFSGKDHFSHRLLKLGLSPRQTVLYTYLASLSFGLGAVTMRYVTKVEAVILCIQFFLVITLFMGLMELVDRKTKKPIEF